MLPKSKADLYAAIRRDASTGMSTRALMRKYGAGYETVQRALISALPEPRKKMRPRATRLDPYKPVFDAIPTPTASPPPAPEPNSSPWADSVLERPRL
ncbi:hypothetical protein [Streptomyces roseochromogenus]|uniref:HTH IS21-type domain-containing protein n=1 Tax=Streptomyces roseochromogenus subsp. oscitans DS 12.976 TaxID=1352936 RepID=V6KUR9_STRRC|nr:hypothetical protein [Streptomyces roseochromogenus]EST32704.1 hypothetical protein M878_14180 [Streptomyces roseochromogenus subsp. oscitans DS 12.976]